MIEMRNNRKIKQDKRMIAIAKITHKKYPDLPLKFIIETLEAQVEIKKSLGEEYEFGIIT